MVDHVDRTKRSLIMASVRSRDTKPELAVRRMLYSLGYRYRLHSSTLPGKPDLVFPSRCKVVFVHGCFWHRHRKCQYATTPKTRVNYWEDKFDANVARDRRTVQSLKKMGWAVATVWQCELKDPQRLVRRLNDFLSE